ncbi:unnamed protein product, partial [Oppiella nova]
MNKTGGTRLATVTARYYFDRILRIVPLYYLSFYFYLIYVRKPKLGIIALILGNVWSICSVFYIIYSNGITTEGVREVLIYNNNPVNPVYNPTGSMYFLHITAFRYGTAYFTGIIFGYLM